MSHHFTLQANYTYAHAIDNVISSTLTSEIQTGQGVNFLALAGLSDSFVGKVPTVTDPGNSASGCPSRSNADAAFIACNGAPVPKAGTFYNGANIDKGPSDLALNHTFLMHGIYQLPWNFEVSSIFHAQSGFHYSISPAEGGPDFDGDGLFNGAGLSYLGQQPLYARNSQTAPPFVNLDMRLTKRFTFGEHFKAQVLFEMFNLLNRDNSAAVNGLGPCNPYSTDPTAPPCDSVFQNQGDKLGVGKTRQYLPGREGQVGIRFEF
jgi:hypothetical protein